MASVDSSVFFLSLNEINAKLRAKEFSCRELTRAALDRLERRGREYNAVALILRNEALRKAGEVDDEIGRERFRGPLQGAPYGAKDLLSFAGQPTTWGAAPLAGQVFDYTATVLRKLEGAGAVLTAKLAMVELAGGGGYRSPAASLHGPGKNPWDTSRWSGGSSSGPGSAVAAGLVAFALGSETNGSILTPSAYCGLTGLRPTYGYVSRHGAMPLSWTMDKIGPMCRTAEDCGQVLDVISGGDRDDPSHSGKRFYYVPQFARRLADLRMGFAPVDFDSWAAPAIRPALREALEVLRSTGMQAEETELPDFPYNALVSTIISSEGAGVFEDFIVSGAVDRLADRNQIAGLKAALDIPARDYLRAMRVRSLVQESMRNLMRNLDVLVAPTRLDVAPPWNEELRGGPQPSPAPSSRGMRDLISAGNLAGLPALTLPCGFADGLPVGICLVGKPFTENTLIVVGKEFQNRTDWHKRRPPE
jgi:aspartyl-tRNA(Asn)/glutamyl-tRNA(Gln) amidotransferase subunit A